VLRQAESKLLWHCYFHFSGDSNNKWVWWARTEENGREKVISLTPDLHNRHIRAVTKSETWTVQDACVCVHVSVYTTFLLFPTGVSLPVNLVRQSKSLISPSSRIPTVEFKVCQGKEEDCEHLYLFASRQRTPRNPQRKPLKLDLYFV